MRFVDETGGNLLLTMRIEYVSLQWERVHALSFTLCKEY